MPLIDMSHLPVYQNREQIISSLRDNQVIIVESPTGSGKTTQIPLILFEEGYATEKSIAITQPRRIAAMSVCEFIKKQIDDTCDLVGYKMRFYDTTTPNTRIRIMTDGILLMELKEDPLLSAYSVILVDEAHERSLNIDFILGILKDIIKKRPDLKVIISSATINTQKFSEFFGGCPVVSIDARVYPVDIKYVMPKEMNNLPLDVASLINDMTYQRQPGDILVFLSGEWEIMNTIKYLKQIEKRNRLQIYPLFGKLTKEEQELVFTPTREGYTKVVVATNIAETSITIDGIKNVIDSGNCKISHYNQHNFTSALIATPIAKSSCDQRCGRAGRTSSGTCFRLYSRKDYEKRRKYPEDEISRTDLSEVMLRMSDLGIYDYENFNYITRPPKSSILSAEVTLRDLGAIDEKRHLTEIGELMVKFPLIPRHARILAEALLNYSNVMDEVIIAISFLSTKSVFLFPVGFEYESRNAQKCFTDRINGDFFTYLNVFRSFEKVSKDPEEKRAFCREHYLDYEAMCEVVHIYEQISDIVTELGCPIFRGGSVEDYLMCIATGLKQFICQKNRNEYNSRTVKSIYLHPSCSAFSTMPKFIIAGELVATTKLFARTVSPITKEMIDKIDPKLSKDLAAMSKGRSGKIFLGDINYEAMEISDKELHRDEKPDPNMVKLGNRAYRKIKGKRNSYQVSVPYEDIQYVYDITRKNRSVSRFNAVVTIKDLPAFSGRMTSLIRLAGRIDTKKFIKASSYPQENVTSENIRALIDMIDSYMLALVKRNKSISTVGLSYLNGNWYQFKLFNDYIKALEESLYALGMILEQIDREDDPESFRIVHSIYRRLEKVFS